MRLTQWFLEKLALRRQYIDANMPIKSGVTKEKRKEEVIISLTSHPGRIQSAYKTIRTLLHQDTLPDRVILWLAREQFPNQDDVPSKLRRLQKFGLEIKWYHDIRAYKKLIPALIQYPNAVIVTVDDDWYYRKDMLSILLEEHQCYPDQVICHAVTRVRFNEEDKLVSGASVLQGTSSYFNKLLGGSGTLYPSGALDDLVLDENLFMEIAPTNDDIWLWGMAVKKATKIRLAKNASGIIMMTDAENQWQTSLANENSCNNIYFEVTNQMVEMFPDILKNLKYEQATENPY